MSTPPLRVRAHLTRTPAAPKTLRVLRLRVILMRLRGGELTLLSPCAWPRRAARPRRPRVPAAAARRRMTRVPAAACPPVPSCAAQMRGDHVILVIFIATIAIMTARSRTMGRADKHARFSRLSQ